jgi:hypothetical protein
MSLLLAFLLKHWRVAALVAFLAAVAGASLYRGYQWGKADGDAEVRAIKAALAEAQAEEAIELAQQVEANRKKEQALADQIAKADARHAQDLKDVEYRSAATVAGLRAGSVKLRDHWQRCLAAKVPGAGETADDPGELPGDADLRKADIGRVQAIGGTCDSKVKFWQTSWEQAVQAVNAQSTGG